jgi:hypothetical protein
MNKPGCGPICGQIIRLVEEAFWISEYLGLNDHTAEFLSSTADLNKALDRVYASRSSLRRLSVDAGWSHESWDALCRGEYGSRDTGLPTAVEEPSPAGLSATG